MYFHVGDNSIFLYRCKITRALNSPHAMIGDCIGRQPNVSCVSYGLLLLAESCDDNRAAQRVGGEGGAKCVMQDGIFTDTAVRC